MELFNILPNLAIGVVAILALAYVTREFITHLGKLHAEHKEQLGTLHESHLGELKERETHLRGVEKEVRDNVIGQLGKNTQVMDRVITHLDRH